MKINMFLDSGAFGNWTQQFREMTRPADERKTSPITPEELAEAIIYLKGTLFVVANLDVIPGQFGRLPTAVETEQAARGSWENLKKIEELVDDYVMPVFHYGESFTWLDRMLKEGYDYIGIGGVAKVSGMERQQWLDRVFIRLCGKDGRPCVKTHGFGVTSPELMARYPWYTVDSRSARKYAAYGWVMIPPFYAGEYRFDKTPYTLSFTQRAGREVAYQSLPDREKDYADTYLKSIDIDPRALLEHHYARERANLRYFHRFIDFVSSRRRLIDQKVIRPTGFFDKPDPVKTMKPIEDLPLRIFHGYNHGTKDLHVEEGCFDLLAPYCDYRTPAKLEKFREMISQ